MPPHGAGPLAQLQPLQPVVLLGEGVFVASRRPAGPAEIVTASGRAFPLAPLATLETWRRSSTRRAAAGFGARVLGRAARLRSLGSREPLIHFLAVVVPLFERRRWTEAWIPDDPGRPGPAPPTLAAAAADLSRAEVPVPCLLVLGRLWRLLDRAVPRGLHVRIGRARLAPAGVPVGIATVDGAWDAAMAQAVDRAARALAEADPGGGQDSAALAELEATGAVERGDLVYLDTTPPRLAHLLPPHANSTLRRRSDRDLALSAPLRVPPSLEGAEDLAVFERNRSGGWSPVDLPHGICFGAGAPPPIPEPDIALAVQLAWGATRLATNGRFHVND